MAFCAFLIVMHRHHKQASEVERIAVVLRGIKEKKMHFWSIDSLFQSINVPKYMKKIYRPAWMTSLIG